jgi:hypothetical protein
VPRYVPLIASANQPSCDSGAISRVPSIRGLDNKYAKWRFAPRDIPVESALARLLPSPSPPSHFYPRAAYSAYAFVHKLATGVGDRGAPDT